MLVNGELRKVSEFAHLKPTQRPEDFCSLCKEEVILRPGKIRIHHYGHKSNSSCPATTPEGALHLNTKLHIYKELLKSKVNFFKIKCKKSFEDVPCEKIKRNILVKEWDQVEVEYSFDKLRPDIAVLKENKLIGAIEVIVTNPDNKVVPIIPQI
ncbi:competence protein CoiA family protein [Candidatus Riflebacteria bacterium]